MVPRQGDCLMRTVRQSHQRAIDRVLNRRDRHIATHDDFADLHRQNKMNAVLDRLLVPQQPDLQFRAADADRSSGWVHSRPERPVMAALSAGGDHFQAFGEMRRGAHPPRYGLAVKEARVLCLGFERMPERVAEIENAAEPGFPFVRGYHFGLDPHGFGDDVIHDFGRLREDLVTAFGENAEQRLAHNDARLDDLVEPGAVLARGQGCQHGRIDQNRQGLVETADQVLARDQIDACLAADGRVHLGEQSGRNLNHGDAAHEDRGEESRHIGDDAAADGYDNARAIGAALHHLLGELLDCARGACYPRLR